MQIKAYEGIALDTRKSQASFMRARETGRRLLPWIFS
jgi:hypothetical protein